LGAGEPRPCKAPSGVQIPLFGTSRLGMAMAVAFVVLVVLSVPVLLIYGLFFEES
jgi:hypothetical protein